MHLNCLSKKYKNDEIILIIIVRSFVAEILHLVVAMVLFFSRTERDSGHLDRFLVGRPALSAADAVDHRQRLPFAADGSGRRVVVGIRREHLR